jgi:hypothetical protein
LFLKIKTLIFICREDDEDMINDQKQKYLKKRKSRELKIINDRSPSIDATQTEAQTELHQVKKDLTRVSFFLSYLSF